MKSAIKLIKDFNLIQKGDTIGVAFSGGSDSMALLHFLHATKDKIGFNIVAIHINHGIRKESEQEAEFAKRVCKELNIEFIYKKLNVLELASKQKLGVEECARIERYKVFDELLQSGDVNKIALAHHQSDQSETIMLNILRGSGVNGACGMDYVRGNYIRPLLDTSKKEIMQYIKDNKLSYVTDASNECNDYSRNYIRNVIFVELNKMFKNTEKAFCEFAKKCKDQEKLLQEKFDFTDLKKIDNIVQIPNKYFTGNLTISHKAIKQALNMLGEYKDFTKKHTELISGLINKNNGTTIDLPNGIIAVKDYDYISLLKHKSNNITLYLPLKEIEFNFNKKYKIEIKKEFNYKNKQNNILVLDFDKLPKGCVIRTRQDGDVFKKFGSGEKKLKEFFIDNKISNYLRDDIPLITLCNRVYCVMGYEISDDVKCDDKTKNFLVLSVVE